MFFIIYYCVILRKIYIVFWNILEYYFFKFMNKMFFWMYFFLFYRCLLYFNMCYYVVKYWFLWIGIVFYFKEGYINLLRFNNIILIE